MSDFINITLQVNFSNGCNILVQLESKGEHLSISIALLFQVLFDHIREDVIYKYTEYYQRLF